jgi:hypothetical protein
MDFPTSPVLGDQVVIGALSWTYNGSAWQRTINHGQFGTVFVPLSGLIVIDAIELPNLDIPFTLITHI